MGDKDTLQPLRMNGTYEDGLKSVRTNSALMTRGICGERRHPSLWSCTHTRAQAAEKLKEEVHGDAGARSLGAAPGPTERPTHQCQQEGDTAVPGGGSVAASLIF